MGPSLELKSFIECSVRGLCKKADDVRVNVVESGGKNICFLIFCSSSDKAFLIGREGKNIKAIRELAWSIAAKNQYKATIIIDE